MSHEPGGQARNREQVKMDLMDAIEEAIAELETGLDQLNDLKIDVEEDHLGVLAMQLIEGCIRE